MKILDHPWIMRIDTKLWLNNDLCITKMCKLIHSPTHLNKTQMDLLNHFLH